MVERAEADAQAGLQPDPILGKPLANYPSDRFRAIVVAGVIGVTVALVLNFTLATLPTWWGPVLTVVIMAATGLALGWYALHIWNQEIILYERGFTYREGSQAVPLLYAEIRGVRLRAERLRYFGGLVRRDSYRFTVTTTRDEQFTLTNRYRRAPELGTRLAERVEAALRPQVERQLAAGEAVAFTDATHGGLALTALGLQANGGTLLWPQFGGWRAGGGKLTLLTADGAAWFSAPPAEIENLTLLLALLRQGRDSVDAAGDQSPASGKNQVL